MANGCQIVDLSHSLKKESDVMGEADDLPRKNLYLLLNPDGSLPLIIRRREKIVMNQILHSHGLRSTGFTTSSSRHWLEQNMRNIIMAMAMILVICKMSQESFGSFLSGSKAKKGDQNSPEVAPVRAGGGISMESGISSGMLSLT